jgi:hypothetical protein
MNDDGVFCVVGEDKVNLLSFLLSFFKKKLNYFVFQKKNTSNTRIIIFNFFYSDKINKENEISKKKCYLR